MITALTQFISTLTSFPQRSAYGSSGAYALAVETWLGEEADMAVELSTAVPQWNTMIGEMNDVASLTDDNSAAAVSAANHKGNWSDLTGALNVPASVTHTSDVWLLNVNLADVTLSEPTGANTDWVNLTELVASIDDTVTTTSKAWSGSKISTELATKSDTTHNHTGTYEPADGTILKDADIGVTVASETHSHTGTYEPADATILKDADIGVNVQAYDATILVDADIGVNVQAYDATILVDADIGDTIQSRLLFDKSLFGGL